MKFVRRLAEGDTAAFDALYDEYRARIYSFLVRLSRRRDIAEDLLEETWIRLIENAGRLKADTRLGAWLFTVARNLYFSYCRSRAVEDERVAGIMGIWPGLEDTPSPFAEAAASELERRVELALSSMPAQYREVMLLSWIEEMTPAEMAAMCGITPETLRQRLSRARALLARKLEYGRERREHKVLQEVEP